MCRTGSQEPLASTGSRLVAFVIPSLSNIVFPDVLRGASAILEENRYQAVFSVTDYDPAEARKRSPPRCSPGGRRR